MPRTVIPKNAPAFASKEELINAPIEEVWAVLTDFKNWTQWNENVSSMELHGPLAAGTEFHWVAGGMKIKSRIKEVVPPNRIIWSGTTMGIKAMHLWELSPVEAKTTVYTEESFQGLIVRLFVKHMKRKLNNALAQSLEALKNEVEMWHNRAKV